MKRISIVLIAVAVIAGMVGYAQLAYRPTIDSTATAELLTAESGALGAYARLPLLFIENQGQMDEEVRYYVKGSGHTIYVSDESVTFDLVRYDSAKADAAADRLVLSLGFVGANSQPAIEGSDKDGSIINYFIGNDPEEWYSNVPTYRELVYKGIYPNIDLRLYGDSNMLRYDFIVNPGATPDTIALAYDGVDRLAIQDDNLIISTALGDMKQIRPYSYQQIGNEKVEIDSSFRLISGNSYGFRTACYDTSRPLIIDPTLSYSTFLGGSMEDYGFGIALDSLGCAYLTGWTDSNDFPTTPGSYKPEAPLPYGGYDAFVTKLDPSLSGNESLIYSTFFGSDTGETVGSGIAVDSSGCAYVVGSTNPEIPTTPGAYNTSFNGGGDLFILKLGPAGDTLLYSTYLGGSCREYYGSIAVDSSENVYVMAHTESDDFPTTASAYDGSKNGPVDIMIAKLNLAGAGADDLVYSTYLGGSNYDWEGAIGIDSSGCVYVTGLTESANFPTTPNAYDTTFNGNYDVFVSKLNPLLTGTEGLVYSTYLGGSGEDHGYGMTVDDSGCIYVGGTTMSTTFPTTAGAFDTSLDGYMDAFVAKLDPSLTGTDSLIYSTYIGGSDSDSGYGGIAVDEWGYICSIGITSSTDFPTTPDAYDATHNGGWDIFVARLTPAGTGSADLLHSTYLGGSEDETMRSGYATTIDDIGRIYLVGDSRSADFPTQGAYQGMHAVGDDPEDVGADVICVVLFEPVIGDMPDSVDCPSDQAQTLTVSNDGAATLIVGDISITGADADQFLIQSDEASNQRLPPSGSADLQVTFNPIEDEGLVTISEASATLLIPSNDPYDPVIELPLTGHQRSIIGCFIATAAYDTPMAEEVQTLRDFRDGYLLTNPLGQVFVDLYYNVSPPIAEFINDHPSLKPMVRVGLVPVVAVSTVVVNSTTTEKAVALAVLVLVSAAITIWVIRRRSRGSKYA